jgi:hypothetical protein
MNFWTTLLQTIAFVPTVVKEIEGLFTDRTGRQKKDAAMSFLQAAMSTSSAVASKQIVDQVRFTNGLGKVIDGAVECFNASVWAKPTSERSAIASQHIR